MNKRKCRYRILGRTVLVISCILLFTGCKKKTSSQTERETIQAAESIMSETERETSPATESIVPETERETIPATESIVPETEAETAAKTEENPEQEPVLTIYVDEEIWTGEKGWSVSPDSDDDTRVYITFGGYPLIDLPFEEPHSVLIHQRNGSENLVRLTGEAVYMERATCDGGDCVNMGEVTRENLEMRVLGGFIICLPNMISVEVRSSS